MKLTKGQAAFLKELRETGFIIHAVRFGASQRNRCGWALVDKGLAEFDFGPRDSFLQTYGFMPILDQIENNA